MILGTGHHEVAATHRFERASGFPCWTIAANFSGSVLTQARGASKVLNAPCINLTRPRTPYRIETGHPGLGWREVWAIFTPRPEWLPLLDWPEYLPGMGTIANRGADFDAVLAAMLEVDRLAKIERGDRLLLADNQLERVLLLAHAFNPLAPHARRHPVVRKALHAIESHWHECLDVAALAKAAGCSASHLAHRFAADMGTTPMAYLEAHRIERAKYLLVSTTMAVKEVAAAVGFANPFHFSTRFRRLVGRSPMEWRLKPA